MVSALSLGRGCPATALSPAAAGRVRGLDSLFGYPAEDMRRERSGAEKGGVNGPRSS
jgi:hypothetical protein